MTKHMMPKAPITALMEALKPAGVVGNPRSGGSDMTSILSELRNEIGRIGESQRGRMETIANRLETLEIRNQDLEQQLAASGRVIGSPVESWGAQVVNSTTFRSAAADGTHRFKINQAITSTGGSGGALIGRDTRTDPVQLARRRLTIRDLLNPGRTTSNMVEFARQTTRTNNAAPTSEGAQKPESVYAWGRAEAPFARSHIGFRFRDRHSKMPARFKPPLMANCATVSTWRRNHRFLPGTVPGKIWPA